MNQLRRLLCAVLLAAASAVTLAEAQTPPPQTPATMEKGPAVGQQIPPFKARDQFGREQTLLSLAGPRGLVLLFFRSADW